MFECTEEGIEKMAQERREQERQLTPLDYRDDGFCTACGAWLPNEYHEEDCSFILAERERRRVSP